jgi:hypothetical protein
MHSVPILDFAERLGCFAALLKPRKSQIDALFTIAGTRAFLGLGREIAFE